MEIIKQLNAEMEALEEYGDQFERQIARRSAKLAHILRLARLDSVGAFVDTTTGLVTPELHNGDPVLDEDQAVHLDDCMDSWFSSLSKADTIMCARVRYRIRGEK